MSWFSRLANVFRSSKLDRDLDDELQFHIEERIRALMADGMSRQEAAAQVSQRFGNTLRLREKSRDVKVLPWLDSLLRDFRLGFRMLRKLFDPGKSSEELERMVAAPISARSAATGASPLRTQFERPLSILAAIAVLSLAAHGCFPIGWWLGLQPTPVRASSTA